MKRILLSAASSIAMLACGQSFAADMAVKAPPAVPPVAAWSGVYFGVSVGEARNAPDAWLFDTGFATTAFPRHTALVGGFNTTAMWQFGYLVAGWQSDFRLASLTNDATCPNTTFLCRQHTGDMYTTGPRAGLAWNDWLLYGTGGYARTWVDTTIIPLATPTLSIAATSHGYDGWYGGGGIEWAWTPNIHFGVQYTHIQVNSRTNTAILGGVVTNWFVNDHVNMIEARINLKLWGEGGPFVPR
jgi:outer membrane immunogenic protein